MAVDVGSSSHSISNHQSQAVTHLHRDINRRIVDANSVVRVLDIVEDASQDFNAVNISTAFHRLARMWRDLPELSSTAPGGQGRLHNALQTLMQLAVIHIKEVHCSSNAQAQTSHNSCLLADNCYKTACESIICLQAAQADNDMLTLQQQYMLLTRQLQCCGCLYSIIILV